MRLVLSARRVLGLVLLAALQTLSASFGLGTAVLAVMFAQTLT